MQPPHALHHGAGKALGSTARTGPSRTATALAAALAPALVGTRGGETFTRRHETRPYDAVPGTARRHFRPGITANSGAPDILQLADVQFSNGDTPAPAPDEMRSGPRWSCPAEPSTGTRAGTRGAGA